MESNISFACGNITLEGKLNELSGKSAVVICHPHPLYGGNMDNPVVNTIAQAFFGRRFTTLRFNFRGTCGSTGMFDEGIGEVEDVKAALRFLNEKGYETLYLAGYSFGARINATVVSNGCDDCVFDIKDHIMVSPPAGFMSFDDIDQMPDTGLIIAGKNDDIAPVNVIKGHIKRWEINPRFEIIEDGDHFYAGCLTDLENILKDYLA